MCHIDSCSLLLMGYELSLKHISMRKFSDFTPSAKIVRCTLYQRAADGTSFEHYVTAIVLHELDILISYVLTMAYLVMSCHIIRWQTVII